MKTVTTGGKPPAVGKLLRVLVAGGVALAGAASTMAVAAEDQAPPEKAEKTATGKPGAKGAADQAAPEKGASKKGSDKKDEKKEEKKKAPGDDDAGGVKGW
jgi:hypothetical protein